MTDQIVTGLAAANVISIVQQGEMRQRITGEMPTGRIFTWEVPPSDEKVAAFIFSTGKADAAIHALETMPADASDEVAVATFNAAVEGLLDSTSISVVQSDPVDYRIWEHADFIAATELLTRHPGAEAFAERVAALCKAYQEALEILSNSLRTLLGGCFYRPHTSGVASLFPNAA